MILQENPRRQREEAEQGFDLQCNARKVEHPLQELNT